MNISVDEHTDHIDLEKIAQMISENGSHSFNYHDIEYRLTQGLKHGIRIDAYSQGGKKLGYVFTSQVGRHNGLEVFGGNRGQGIGKILFRVKTAIDGILPFEWTWNLSHLLFLIKEGYVPISTTLLPYLTITDRTLSSKDLKILRGILRSFMNGEIPDGPTQTPVRLKYSPGEAAELLKLIYSLEN